MVVNLVAPLVIGEVFPFTISPMFSDLPSEYCIYQVLDENGQPIDSEPFGLHLVYDGNPPGLGMGIQPRATLHGFGETASLEQLKAHIQQKLADMPEREFVTVEQSLVCCVDNCPVESVNTIRISRSDKVADESNSNFTADKSQD